MYTWSMASIHVPVTDNSFRGERSGKSTKTIARLYACHWRKCRLCYCNYYSIMKNILILYTSLYVRVSHKKIEFFLFDLFFRGVPKKVERFYFKKTVPVLEKVIVFANKSIRQHFCFFSHQNVAWSTNSRILWPFLTSGLFLVSKNFLLFLVPT